MSDDREIVCSRFVFEDSEFDAKKGRGERPGPPVCIARSKLTKTAEMIEHRLAAPYPEAATLGSRRSVSHNRLCAFS